MRSKRSDGVELDLGESDRDCRETAQEVMDGLSSEPKRLPSKLFYDETGSKLFDEICDLPEYYIPDAESEILRTNAGEIADRIGPGAALIEPGAGSCVKVRYLLDALDEVACFVPIDVSGTHLESAASDLQESYPELEVVPVEGDFTGAIDIPELPPETRRRVAFFPGSTIGNFEEEEAEQILRNLADVAGDDGGVLVGVDLVKCPDVISAAYNDSAGVTARFNKNILRVLNRELGADIDEDRFEHRAVYDHEAERIEMRLVSRCDQSIRVAKEDFSIERGEYVITEYSHKYSHRRFAKLAARAGLREVETWCDEDDLFSVRYFEVDGAAESTG